MFYIAIITWIFLSSNNIYITNDYRYISLGSIFSHFLLLHGLNPNWQDSLVPGGWSVAVESIFYIFCPLFFRYITSLNKSIIFLTISIYIGSIITYLLNSLSIIPNDWKREGWLYGYFPNQAYVFFTGFMLYFLQFESNFKKIKTLFIILLLIIPNFLIYRILKYNIHNEINIVASYFFILLFFLLKDNKFQFLKSNFIQLIGRYSYSIYIIHFIFLHFIITNKLNDLFFNSTLNYFIIFITTLLFSIIISYFTYNYIELKFIYLGKKIIKNLSKKNPNISCKQHIE
jgi:peptidoglycan/LPS O-acetylase OafA/YrhL